MKVDVEITMTFWAKQPNQSGSRLGGEGNQKIESKYMMYCQFDSYMLVRNFMFLPSHSGGEVSREKLVGTENKQTLYLKGQEGRREERRKEAGREGRRGWEEREGKGRALMLLPLLLFFCVIRLTLFVLLTPLAKEFLLTMYTVYTLNYLRSIVLEPWGVDHHGSELVLVLLQTPNIYIFHSRPWTL